MLPRGVTIPFKYGTISVMLKMPVEDDSDGNDAADGLFGKLIELTNAAKTCLSGLIDGLGDDGATEGQKEYEITIDGATVGLNLEIVLTRALDPDVALDYLATHIIPSFSMHAAATILDRTVNAAAVEAGYGRLIEGTSTRRRPGFGATFIGLGGLDGVTPHGLGEFADGFGG